MVTRQYSLSDRAKKAQYYQGHKAEINERWKKYYQQHRNAIIEWNKQYRQTHQSETREYKQGRKLETNEYYRLRRQNNPMLRLHNCMSHGICESLKGNKNGRHWEDLVDYTVVELAPHLEALFTDGMNWGNHGMFGWHIDHIRPKSSFYFMEHTDSEFRKCWALNNLQPLWSADNLRKSAKV